MLALGLRTQAGTPHCILDSAPLSCVAAPLYHTLTRDSNGPQPRCGRHINGQANISMCKKQLRVKQHPHTQSTPCPPACLASRRGRSARNTLVGQQAPGARADLAGEEALELGYARSRRRSCRKLPSRVVMVMGLGRVDLLARVTIREAGRVRGQGLRGQAALLQQQELSGSGSSSGARLALAPSWAAEPPATPCHQHHRQRSQSPSRQQRARRGVRLQPSRRTHLLGPLPQRSATSYHTQQTRLRWWRHETPSPPALPPA